jgi:regulator of replication initiation timing
MSIRLNEMKKELSSSWQENEELRSENKELRENIGKERIKTLKEIETATSHLNLPDNSFGSVYAVMETLITQAEALEAETEGRTRLCLELKTQVTNYQDLLILYAKIKSIAFELSCKDIIKLTVDDKHKYEHMPSLATFKKL